MQVNIFISIIILNLIYQLECIHLEIYANGLNVTKYYYLAKMKESLTLTCKLVGINDSHHRYSLEWRLPRSYHANQNYIRPNIEINETSLDILSVQKNSKGEYACTCKELNITTSFTLNVKGYQIAYCGPSMFVCEKSGKCIAQHYVCDGKVDCKYGEDENYKCGKEPCEGKFRCDGRCIPINWCCINEIDPNCTVKERPACCKVHFKFQQEHQVHQDLTEYNTFKHGLLKATVFTLFVCTITFFFLVSICLLVLCRIHIYSCPGNRDLRDINSRTRIPFYDLYLYLNRNWNNLDQALGYRQQEPNRNPNGPNRFPTTNNINYNLVDNGSDGGYPHSIPSDPLPHRLLFMSYINNEVQYVNRPASPPPYSDICDNTPALSSNVASNTCFAEPPPPYVSRENITENGNKSDDEDGECVGRNGYTLVTTQSDEEFLDRSDNEIGGTSCGITYVTTANDNERSDENCNILTEETATAGPKCETSKYDTKQDFLGVDSTLSSTSACSISLECDSIISYNMYPPILPEDFHNNNSEFEKPNNEIPDNLCESHINQLKQEHRARPRSLNCDSPINLDNRRNIFVPLVRCNSGDINAEQDLELLHKRRSLIRHSIADLSPSGSNEYRYFEIPSYDRETRLLTLPLRESFIGLRKE